jgi:histidinol-phosphate aminotransferase
MDRVPVRDDLADVVPYGAPQLDVPVRLNTNEMPFAPPPVFFEQLAKRIAALDLHRYPDRRAWALRTAIGRRFAFPPDRVWAANGSNEILLQLFQAYGGPGRTLLLTSPGYSAHPLIAKVTATATVSIGLDDDFMLTPAVAAQAAAHEPALICIASPNNPTGMSVRPDAVRALHDSTDALVILDEAYVEFALDDDRSAAQLVSELPRLVVCRTFSKAWRLAGLRLGYLLAHEWVIDDLRKVRLPYHLDSLTQEAGLVALELTDDITAHVADLVAERDRLYDQLRAIDGVHVWPSDANFLLFRTAREGLFDALLAHGVLIRDFSDKPRLEGCLRVSVGTRRENDTFLDALRKCLQ